MISFNQWTEAQQWAYMASHISRVRWEMPPLPLYQQLGAVLEGKDYYILTSNVDRQFCAVDLLPGVYSSIRAVMICSAAAKAAPPGCGPFILL